MSFVDLTEAFLVDVGGIHLHIAIKTERRVANGIGKAPSEERPWENGNWLTKSAYRAIGG